MATHVARNTKRRISLAIGAAVALAGGATLLTLPAGAAPAEGTVIGAGSHDAVKGSYIVLLKNGGSTHGKTSATRVESAGKGLADEYGGKVARTYGSAVHGFNATGMSAQEARRLAADDQVAQVFQNQRITTTAATQKNPPSWGLDRIDQKSRKLNKTYTYPSGAGAGVTAYIIDTGVRISHKDFGGRASYGYDAVDEDKTAQDGNGHGTHVAGTVAGTRYGVAKKADIVAVRVLDDEGSGTTALAVAGVDWVTEHHKGPSVANMSLGGNKDAALDAAVQRSISSGVTYAVSAGNEGADASTSSPARVPEALTVAAADKKDAQAEFSNHGKLVDLFAPGVDIVSASNKSDTGTATMSGTSMASPHVAGAAAVYLSGHKDATPAQVTAALTKGATAGTVTDPAKGTTDKLLRVVK